jgi:hypothetical protein
LFPRCGGGCAQYKALAMHDDELMERPAFAETVPRA